MRLSIDDFGTGYTSLGTLKNRLAFTLKIDRSFIDAMDHSPNDAIIVQSIIELGHRLGYTVVAEGVERRETLDQLRALGCDQAQGYFLCRPVLAENFVRWLASSPWGNGGKISG